MIGWHHRLNGHEFEQTPGDSEGQGNLTWCGPWGHEELVTTERLNNSNKAALSSCKVRSKQPGVLKAGPSWTTVTFPERMGSESGL